MYSRSMKGLKYESVEDPMDALLLCDLLVDSGDLNVAVLNGVPVLSQTTCDTRSGIRLLRTS